MAKASDLPEPPDPNDPKQQPADEGNVDFSSFLPGSPIPGDPASGSNFSWADAYANPSADPEAADLGSSSPLRFDAVSDKDLLRQVGQDDPGQRGPAGYSAKVDPAEVTFPAPDAGSFYPGEPNAGEPGVPMAESVDDDEGILLPGQPHPPQADAYGPYAESSESSTIPAAEPVGQGEIGSSFWASAQPAEADVPMAEAIDMPGMIDSANPPTYSSPPLAEEVDLLPEATAMPSSAEPAEATAAEATPAVAGSVLSGDPLGSDPQDVIFAVEPTTGDDSLWPGSGSLGTRLVPPAEPIEDDLPAELAATADYVADDPDETVSFEQLDEGPLSGGNSSILGSLDMGEQMPPPQQSRRKTDPAERPYHRQADPEMEVSKRPTDPEIGEADDDLGGIFDEVDTPAVGPSSEVDILPSASLPPVQPPPPRAKPSQAPANKADDYDGSEIDLLSSEFPSSAAPKQKPLDDSNVVDFDGGGADQSNASDAIFGSDIGGDRPRGAGDSILEDFDEGIPQVSKAAKPGKRPESTFESALPPSVGGLSPTGGFPAYVQQPAVSPPTSSGFTGAYQPAIAEAQPVAVAGEQPAKSRGRFVAWIGGGLLGLLAGIGLVAGPLATGSMPEDIRNLLVPPDKVASAVKNKDGNPLIPPPVVIPKKEPKLDPIEKANKLLRMGDLKAALEVIDAESKGKKIDDPRLLAERGRLTWQNYRAERLSKNKQIDPKAKEVDRARKDLEGASQKLADAAYWLGQLEAGVGNLAEALKIYEDAIKRFPEESETFADARDVLLSRLTAKREQDNEDIAPPQEKQNAPDDDLPWSGLDRQPFPGDTERHARLLLAAVCLGDLGSGKADSPPGPPSKQLASAAKLLREAIELTNKDQTSAALAKISQARRAYMFIEPENVDRSREINNMLVVCDRLSEAIAGQERIRKNLAEFKIDPRDPAKAISELAAQAKEAETYKRMIDEAEKSLALAKVVEKERDAIKLDLAKVEKERDAIKLDLGKVEKEYKLAKDNLATAESKLQELVDQSKVTNQKIAALAAELKKAKAIAVDPDQATIRDVADGVERLIQLGDKDKGRELLERLSTLQKQLADEKTRADEAIKSAKQLADTRKAELAKAEKALADAQARAQKELLDLETKLKAERADAIRAAIADKQKEIAELRGRLGKESELVRNELSGRIIALEKEVADLKAYSTKLEQLLGSESRLKDASIGDKHFAVAYTRFFQGRYAEAESEFKQAIEAFAADARYYYFLGLAQYQQGKTKDAEASLRQGAELERMGRTSPMDISLALERIQGPLRRYVYQFRP